MNETSKRVLAVTSVFIFIFGQIPSGWGADLLEQNVINQQAGVSVTETQQATETEDSLPAQPVIGGTQTTLTQASASLTLSPETFDNLGRLTSSLDDQAIKTSYRYGTGANQFRVVKLIFSIPKGTVLPDGGTLAVAKTATVEIADSMTITPDADHSGVVKTALLDMAERGENVGGVVWELQPTRLEQNPSTACDSTDDSFECDFRLQGAGRGHFEYSVQADTSVGSPDYTANLLESGPAEDHYDSLGRLSTDTDNQGVKTSYIYGLGPDKFELTKLVFTFPKDALDTGVPPVTSTVQAVLKGMTISPDTIHSGAVKAMFRDLLESGENVTGVTWELMPTRLQSNPPTVCDSTGASFECDFRIQALGRGHYEYQVATEVDALGNASHSAILQESGFAVDRVDSLGRLNFDIDNQGIKTSYFYGTGANKFKVTKLVFSVPKGTVLPGGSFLTAAKQIQVKVSDLFNLTADATHSGTIKTAFLDMLSRGDKVTGVIWGLEVGHTRANAPASCASAAASFNCEFRIEAGRNYFEYNVQTNVDPQGHVAYSPQRLQSGRILFDVQFNFLRGIRPFVPGQPEEHFLIQQDTVGNVFLLTEINGLLVQDPLAQSSFVIPSPNAPYQLRIPVKILDPTSLGADLTHTGVVKSALIDMLSKGEKISGIAWKFLPTREQHKFDTGPNCTSGAPFFQCEFRLEGGPKFFEYQVVASVQSPTSAFYFAGELAAGLIANAPLTFQKFSNDGRILVDLDEVGIKTQYFYNSRTKALEKLVFNIPKGTVLPGGLVLEVAQAVTANLDALIMQANTAHSGMVKEMFLDILGRGIKIAGSPWSLQPSHVSRQASLASTVCSSSQTSFGCSFRLERDQGTKSYFEYQVQANVDALGDAAYATNLQGSGAVIFEQRFVRHNFVLPFVPGRFIVQTDEIGRVFMIVEREGILFRGLFQLSPVVSGPNRSWRRDGRNFIVRLANGSTMTFDMNDGSIF